ncbi:MAG: DUF2961 domain-containing protein, partial [Verrucomicrobiales bacterium]|nr:DUF2961 domain-containing protein [Verrucomicrobiales bacterium]
MPFEPPPVASARLGHRLRIATLIGAAVAAALARATFAEEASPVPIGIESLLAEMTSPEDLARFPDPPYASLQASSYNRESVHRDRPGWFADSDGIGFLRTETIEGRTEWVLLDHDGPGCLTRIWTPYFYYDLADHVGPNVRIYLDGSTQPVVDESLIGWVTGRSFVKPPFAVFTARAGDLYLPIPFARGCKITLSAKPFYYIVNYRAYPAGTAVTSFDRTRFEAAHAAIEAAGRALYSPPPPPAPARVARTERLHGGGSLSLRLPKGPSALRQLTIRVPETVARPELLRSTVLELEFDGDASRVRCPLGDFFSCTDALHPYETFQRTVAADGTLTCRWVMPYRKSGRVRLTHFGEGSLEASLLAESSSWTWDERSMHFHAGWRPDDIAAGTPFQDWNFVDIRGRGVYVGDAWTVLNPQRDTWWGEGDEKIYVDAAWEKGFPTHFGTGTEDYYGWAGGLVPTRRDEFDEPFLANIRVGGVDGRTQGYNICTRTRALDAIPFSTRLRFDMESSFGTDIRN